MSRLHKTKKAFYLDRVFGQKDERLKKISQAAQAEGVERMQISPHEGCLLYFLTQISQAKTVVEIGTLYAYSTWHIAQALPEGGRVFTLDISLERHSKSQKILKGAKESQKIQWMSGKAEDSLKALKRLAPFDMVFIDADKDGYLDYLDWAEKHLKKGGLLVADNTLLFGAVYGEASRSPKQKTVQAMIEFNKRLSDSSRWTGALIPTAEGLTVGLRR